MRYEEENDRAYEEHRRYHDHQANLTYDQFEDYQSEVAHQQPSTQQSQEHVAGAAFAPPPPRNEPLPEDVNGNAYGKRLEDYRQWLIQDTIKCMADFLIRESNGGYASLILPSLTVEVENGQVIDKYYRYEEEDTSRSYDK